MCAEVISSSLFLVLKCSLLNMKDLMQAPILAIGTKVLIVVAFEAERSGITNKNSSRAGRELAELP